MPADYSDAEYVRDSLLTMIDNMELQGKLTMDESAAMVDAANACYSETYSSLDGLMSAYVNITDVTGLFKAGVQLLGVDITSTGALYLANFNNSVLYTVPMQMSARESFVEWYNAAMKAEQSADSVGFETGVTEQATVIKETVVDATKEAAKFPWKAAVTGAIIGTVGGPLAAPIMLAEPFLILIPASVGFGVGTLVGEAKTKIVDWLAMQKTKAQARKVK